MSEKVESNTVPPPSPTEDDGDDMERCPSVTLPSDSLDSNGRITFPSGNNGHLEPESLFHMRASPYMQTQTTAPTSAAQSQTGILQDRKARMKRLPPLLRRVQLNLHLENSGSVARDHLASERTFLAYVRTSLAIASTGVALVQLFSLSRTSAQSSLTQDIQKYAPRLGAAIICLGISVLFIGITRYFTIQKALTKGHFPVARIVIIGIAAGLVVLIFVVFGILVAGQVQTGQV